MSHQETLKTMLKDIINGREEQAAVTMHDYFVAKTREVSGLSEDKDPKKALMDGLFDAYPGYFEDIELEDAIKTFWDVMQENPRQLAKAEDMDLKDADVSQYFKAKGLK